MKIPLRQYQKLLGKYLRPQWKRVGLLAALLFTGIGLQLVNPQILRQFIDAALAGKGAESLFGLAGIFIAFAIFTQVISLGATYTSENVGWAATNALRNDLGAHCLRLDMPFHNMKTPGQLIERIDGDVTAMANFFSQFVLKIMGNFFLLIGVLVMLFIEDWRIGLALAAFSLFAIIVFMGIRDLAVKGTNDARDAYGNLMGFIEERLAGTEDLRGNGGEKYTLRRLHQINRPAFRTQRSAEMQYNNMFMVFTIVFLLGYLLALGLGAWLYFTGELTIGGVYLIFQYTDMLRNPLDQMTRQLQDLQKAGAGVARVQELFDIQPTIHDGPGAILPDGPLAVEFADVTFSYNGEDKVLENIAFRLEPGKVLGLLGRTGSGKTTLTRLIFRLYEINEGNLRVGGSDVRNMKLRDLRERVALVTQDVQLFHASVRDNLTFFDKSIPDARILEVLHELELGDWFKSLPDGLDTEIKSGGAGLSAGEAQLLAFTRVFLKDPGVVILDEASSRLDPATEKLLERAVDKLLENRTGIIIAHRLATVQRADDILILADGKMQEYGDRATLALNPNSRFSGLLRTGLEEVLV
jgi:ATP-binding cassette, subfamily B, bacterial